MEKRHVGNSKERFKGAKRFGREQWPISQESSNTSTVRAWMMLLNLQEKRNRNLERC